MTENAVIEANRHFYDVIAKDYDRIDCRRGGKVDHQWLDHLLSELVEETRRNTEKRELVFLDAGAGSGFLARMAEPYFSKMILVDVSKEMLDRIPIEGVEKVCANCSEIPLQGGSVDFIGAFATLHHLYNPEEFFREAYRLLPSGGILYTDHDIEAHFVRNFRYPLKVHRYFFDHGHQYLRAARELTRHEYEITEFHGDQGLDGNSLVSSLKKVGFSSVRMSFHWDGMGVPTKILELVGLKHRFSKEGRAPIVRLIATK